VPVPANYNDVTNVTVSPIMLNDAGNSCLSLLNQIINYLNAVETTLSNLQLSWVGQSSDLAQTFTNEWNNATASLRPLVSGSELQRRGSMGAERFRAVHVRDQQ
jgi:hypothetical protein